MCNSTRAGPEAHHCINTTPLDHQVTAKLLILCYRILYLQRRLVWWGGAQVFGNTLPTLPAPPPSPSPPSNLVNVALYKRTAASPRLLYSYTSSGRAVDGYYSSLSGAQPPCTVLSVSLENPHYLNLHTLTHRDISTGAQHFLALLLSIRLVPR